MKKGVCYIRVSKHRDSMITQDTQLRKIKHYCELHDIELVSQYMDLDYSGRSTNRPDFQKLFEDIEENKIDIDYLLVYKLDRFARSVNDFHNYMEILEEKDINFVSITQHFDTSSPMGRLVRNILIDFAQFESEMIGERVKDNMIQNAQNGVWNGGPIPFGFTQTEDTEAANLKPNQEAKHVLQFYKWYIAPGGSIRKCVVKANKLGITTSNNNYWQGSQMSRLLKNPIYCIADEQSISYFEDQGFEVFNKDTADNKRGFICYNRRNPKGKNETIRDKDKWLISVAQHQGIVPAELFIKTQKKRQSRTNKPIRAGTGKSLLAWLLKCGKCGRAMTYSYSTSTLADGTKKKYRYYKCNSKRKMGKAVCEGQSVRAEKIEKVVLDKLSLIHKSDTFFDNAEERLEASFKNSIDLLEEEKELINNQLTEIIKEEDRLINSLTKVNSDKLITKIEEQIEELEKKKKELTENLEEIKTKLFSYEAEEYNKRLILDRFKDFNDNFEQMEFEEKRSFLQTVINRIIYNEGEIELELFL
ncbi:recombinase family protein [Natroniella acetigena]|uniref:recombinase family protein n=1 Tax=Natroniella acetigena TaxID=52004 RepID=UPI00200AE8B2|nr:recombinase family protein [Natroniella acetigena]MCK8827126.1 recombinase family protein [Natroniella acetigena]